MVLFFALFGFLFGATQYLQSVLGYTPLGAGVRLVPYAIAMIAFASASAAVVARLGTGRVVTTGMLLFAGGLAAAATLRVGSGYGPLALAFVLMGAGMGLAGAPATESIMNALPPGRANIGSAVNDTARELGGALGVAILGSILTGIAGDASPAADPGRFVDALATLALVAAAVTAVGALAAARWLPSAPAAVSQHDRGDANGVGQRRGVGDDAPVPLA
jgi:MFS family permease